jgi:hypothetical protein
MDIKEEEVPQVTPERNETADTLTETGNRTDNKKLQAVAERLKERGLPAGTGGGTDRTDRPHCPENGCSVKKSSVTVFCVSL